MLPTMAGRQHWFLFDRFFSSVFIAFIIFPTDDNLVTGFGAFGFETQEGILRDGDTPLRRQDGFAIQGGSNVLDKVRGNDLAGFGILALSGFHNVSDEYLDVSGIAVHLGANFCEFCHACILYIFSLRVVRSILLGQLTAASTDRHFYLSRCGVQFAACFDYRANV
jgi:hypothetical protein